jgi:hypothetical protein
MDRLYLVPALEFRTEKDTKPCFSHILGPSGPVLNLREPTPKLKLKSAFRSLVVVSPLTSTFTETPLMVALTFPEVIVTALPLVVAI